MKFSLFIALTIITLVAFSNLSHARAIHTKRNTPEKRVKNAKKCGVPKTFGRMRKRQLGDDDGLTETPPFKNEVGRIRNFPTGKLVKKDPKTGLISYCVGSVISSKNGNIGITTGSCLFTPEGDKYTDVLFSPGYNKRELGPLGFIAVEKFEAPDIFFEDQTKANYAMFRVAFKDPTGKDLTLQQYTGGLGWKFNVSCDSDTGVDSYLKGLDIGDDCVTDGENLCTWASKSRRTRRHYYITDQDLSSSIGGPWILERDVESRLGILYGTTEGYDGMRERTFSARYVEDEFLELMDKVSK